MHLSDGSPPRILLLLSPKPVASETCNICNKHYTNSDRIRKHLQHQHETVRVGQSLKLGRTKNYKAGKIV